MNRLSPFNLLWILILLFSTALDVSAQTCASNSTNPFEWPSQSNWFLGNGVIYDFNTNSFSNVAGSPTVITSYEGVSAASDDNGNLLFFANGRIAWNAAGADLYTGLLTGNENGATGNNGSASQGLITIRHPLNPNEYYIITTSDVQSTGIGLNYAVLSQAGAVLSAAAPVDAGDYFETTEGITATLHANGVDIWVVVQEYGTNRFHSYLLTCTGFDLTQSRVSNVAKPFTTKTMGRGGLTFSWDGQKFVQAHPIFYVSATLNAEDAATIYDFNKTTGAITNAQDFGNGSILLTSYDVTFSPDNSMVLISDAAGDVYSWDVTSMNAAVIRGTKATFATTAGAHTSIEVGADGNYYISNSGGLRRITPAGAMSGVLSPSNLGLPTMYLPPAEEPIIDPQADLCDTDAPVDLSTNWMCSGDDAEGGIGVYSGPGITNTANGTFDPGTAGIGTHEIIFTYCSVDDTIFIEVTGCSCPDTSIADIAPICVDATTDLSAAQVTADAGTWSIVSAPAGSSPATITGATTFDASGADAGDYVVRFTLSSPTGGCPSFAERTITVNPLPVVNMGNQSMCSGDPDVTFDAGNSGAGFLWSPGGQTSQTIDVSAAATYSVVVTSGAGCSGSGSATLTVHNLPTITATGGATICPGASVGLTAGGGNTYVWSPAAGLDDASSATPIATPAGTTTYTVTGTDGNLCENTAQTTVTIAPNPVATIDPAGPICIGDTAQLNASSSIAGSTFTWKDPTNTLTDVNINNPEAFPTTTTTYEVVVESPIGCKDSTTREVVVNLLPVVDLTNDTICDGDPAVTFDAGNAGAGFLWAPGGETSRTINANTAGEYKVTVTVSGCSASDSAMLVVNALPTITATGGATICPGESIGLTAGGGSSYVWSPATGLDDATSATPIATPAGTTTYTVTGTDGNLCENTAQTTVTVAPAPVAGIDPVNPLCIGDTIQLNATSTVAGSVFTWKDPSSTLTSTSINNPEAFPNTNTTYEVVVETLDGCKDSTTIDVVVNPLPIVDVPSQGTCNNVPVTFDAGNAGAAFLWLPTNETTRTISTATAGDYIVRVTDANLCVNYDTATLTTSGSLPLVISADTAMCEGESAQLSISGALSYVWTPSTGLDNPTSDSPIATPSATTTYKVVATSAQGCKDSLEVTVTINNNPVASIAAVAPICINDTTQLSASSSIAGGSFTWKDPTATLSDVSINNPEAFPTNNATYEVVVETLEGCKDSTTVNVVVNPLPVVDVPDQTTCTGTSVTFDAGNSGAAYLWTPNNETDQTITASVAGDYSVRVTDGNLCVNYDTATLTILASLPLTVTPDTDICENGSIQLNATGATTYLWTPAATLDNPSSDSPVATPTTPTTYKVVGSNAQGCKDSLEVTIGINPNPVATIAPINPICEGENVQLTASSSVAGSSFTWKAPTDGLSSTSIANPVATPVANITYEVLVETPQGCKDSTTVNVVVNGPPTLSVTSDFSMCKGDNEDLIVSGANTYLWSPATGLSSTSGSLVNTSVQTTTTYTVEGTSTAGCKSEASVTVTVLDNPVPQVTISYSNDACEGQEVNFNIASSQFLGSGPSYDWRLVTAPGDTVSFSSSVSPSLTTLNAGDQVLLDVVSNEICVAPGNSTATSNVVSPVIYSYPIPEIEGDTNVCAGEDAALTVTDNAGVALTFTWFEAGTNSNLGNGSSLDLNDVRNEISVYVVASNWNCESTTSNHDLGVTNVSVALSSSDGTIRFGESVDIQAVSNATQFAWSSIPDNANISAQTGASFTDSPEATTIYVVVGTTNGCSAEDEVTVEVLEPISAPYLFTPNGDGFNDTWVIAELYKYAEYDVRIFNRWGMRVRRYQNDMGNGWDGTNDSGTQVPDGVYFYTIDSSIEDEKVSLSGYVTVTK